MKVIDGHVLAHPGLDGSRSARAVWRSSGMVVVSSFWTLTKTCPSMPIITIIRLEESNRREPAKRRRVRPRHAASMLSRQSAKTIDPIERSSVHLAARSYAGEAAPHETFAGRDELRYTGFTPQ